MRGNARTTTRLGAYVASAGLVISGSILAATPAQAVPHDPVGAQTGSSWLVGQTNDGLLQSGYEDTATGNWVLYDDQGLTIDAVESLVEAGQQPAAVQSMTDAVEDDAVEYAGYGPGQAAKLLVLAELTGRNFATFGPGDLVQQVEAKVDDSPGRVGALTGAYDSVISQVFAARALAKAGSGKSAGVTSFLLRQQCTSGYLRESFTAGNDCVEGASAASVDATAIAVIGLASITGNPTVSAAVDKARQWLAGQQQADGSWAAFGAGNANATGLAARALGDTAASEKAARWLYQHQARQGGPAPLTPDTGAIAVDDATYDDAAANGLDERSRTVFVRATAQAVSALRWLPSSATGALTLVGPTNYRKAGSALTFSVLGTKPGHRLTLTGPGASTTGTSTSTTWRRNVTLPSGTATRTYAVADDHGHRATRSVRVLGARTLAVSTSKYRVKRSRVVTVTVAGLAAREGSAVYYRGKLAGRGVASSTGVFRAQFRVGRAKGVKRIIALGAFGDIRRGADTIRVVR